jgi:hypothetical protein
VNVDIVQRGEAIILLVKSDVDLCMAPIVHDRLETAEATDAR